MANSGHLFVKRGKFRVIVVYTSQQLLLLLLLCYYCCLTRHEKAENEDKVTPKEMDRWTLYGYDPSLPL